MSTNVPAPLRTNEPEPAPAPPAPRLPGTYIQCEFCDCQVTRSGEVYQMSEKARSYRDANEKHLKATAKLDEEIAALRATIAAKEQEIAALKPAPALSSKKGFSF